MAVNNKDGLLRIGGYRDDNVGVNDRPCGDELVVCPSVPISFARDFIRTQDDKWGESVNAQDSLCQVPAILLRFFGSDTLRTCSTSALSLE